MIDSSAVVVAIVSAVLGGGLATSFYNVHRARLENKLAPAERFSIVAQGAERAVLSLTKALEEADERLASLRTQLSDERLRTQAGEERIRAFLDHLDGIERVVYGIRDNCEHMDTVLTAIRSARNDFMGFIPKEQGTSRQAEA